MNLLSEYAAETLALAMRLEFTGDELLRSSKLTITFLQRKMEVHAFEVFVIY